MKIPFSSSFLKIKEYFSFGDMLIFWYRHYKFFVFIGFLVALSFGGSLYYYSVYQYHFSEEEKTQYINSYFRETTFGEEKFYAVVDSLAERAWIHNTPTNLKRNIFLKK